MLQRRASNPDNPNPTTTIEELPYLDFSSLESKPRVEGGQHRVTALIRLAKKKLPLLSASVWTTSDTDAGTQQPTSRVVS